MPDIFVPIETGENLAFYNRLINRGIVYDFAFEYTDTHRDYFKKFKNVNEYDAGFEIDDKLFDEFIDFAEANDVMRNDESIAAMKSEIKTLLKALIGRNILDNEGFYPIYHDIDKTFQQAVIRINSTN